MWFPIFAAALAVCGFAPRIHGYVIDSATCQGGDYDFVKSAVENAFTMANLINAKVISQDMDADTDWLFQQLFGGPQDKSARQTLARGFVQQRVVEHDSAGQKRGLLAIDSERKVASANSSYSQLDPYEVVIFCNTDRYEKSGRGGGRFYDPKMQMGVSSDPGSTCRSNFAFTYARDDGSDVIQICSWFLKYIQPFKYKTAASLIDLLPTLAVHGLEKIMSNTKYTPLDAMALFDKVMLHELTHTTVAGQTDDIGQSKGYGWKNCKQLAQTQTMSTRPENNADTWALFGLGLTMQKQSRYFNDDGTFKKDAVSSGKKIKRWMGSQAGRAWDDVQGALLQRFM